MGKIQGRNQVQWTKTRDTSAFQWLDAMEDAIRVVNRDLEVVYENRAMVLKLAQDPLLVKSFPLVNAEQVFRDGQAYRTELCIGPTVYALTCSPVMDGEEVNQVVQVFRDITSQSQFTSQLYGDQLRISREMNFARSLQEDMLPSLTAYGPLRFNYRYYPNNELSGDFFDLVPLGQGKIALYISDVVGHGISASILTMFVRQAMRSILKEEKIRRPGKVLDSLKSRFTEISISDDQYFTIFYALFDTQNHTMTYANAGHNAFPLLKRGDRVEEIQARGMFISPLFDQHRYQQHQLVYQTNDRFLFYTDGATETMNEEGQAFGADRLMDLVQNSGLSMLDTIAQTIDDFRSGSQKDDIALLQVDCLD